MENIIIEMVLGNFIGDYFFQSREMAKNKSQKGRTGTLWCTIHCIIYTLVMCLFLENFNPFFMGLIFLSHYPIDRYSLVYHWLKFVNKGNFPDGSQIPTSGEEIETVFCCIMYAVIDNTMHLFLVWQIVKYFC